MDNHYDFQETVPTLDIERMRQDFEHIFEANSVEVKVTSQRQVNQYESGDFFDDGVRTKDYDRTVEMFVVPAQTDHYQRQDQGITTNDSLFQAFAKNDVEIQSTDIITFIRTTRIADFEVRKGEQFILERPNKPFYKGNTIFQEFDLKRVNKELRR